MGVLFEGGKSRQELQQERLKKTSKMNFQQLRKHIAKKMNNDSGYTDRMKQSRINRAINHPK